MGLPRELIVNVTSTKWLPLSQQIDPTSINRDWLLADVKYEAYLAQFDQNFT